MPGAEPPRGVSSLLASLLASLRARTASAAEDAGATVLVLSPSVRARPEAAALRCFTRECQPGLRLALLRAAPDALRACHVASGRGADRAAGLRAAGAAAAPPAAAVEHAPRRASRGRAAPQRSATAQRLEPPRRMPPHAARPAWARGSAQPRAAAAAAASAAVALSALPRQDTLPGLVQARPARVLTWQRALTRPAGAPDANLRASARNHTGVARVRRCAFCCGVLAARAPPAAVAGAARRGGPAAGRGCAAACVARAARDDARPRPLFGQRLR